MRYPGDEAWNAKKDGFKETVGSKTLLVLILDATWFCAKKMIEHNPFLLELPRFSFYGDYRSIFTFQLTAENERILGIRPNSHSYDDKYSKLKEVPEF